MPGMRQERAYATGRAASSPRLEGEFQRFGDRDFRAVGELLLLFAGQFPAVQPGAVAAPVDNRERAARGVAAQAQELARDLVGGIERKIHPPVLSAASD